MTIEDEAWRSYLESDSVGLTIASSDEDTAGALATLYEYYKESVRFFRKNLEPTFSSKIDFYSKFENLAVSSM